MRFFTKPSGLSIVGLLCVLAVAVPPAHADFWVSNSGTKNLEYFDTTTGTITQTIGFNALGTGNTVPAGIALDSSNNLWVADNSSAYIAEYTYAGNGKWNSGSNGQPSQSIALNGNASNGGGLQGLAVYNGSVYVANSFGSDGTSVWQYNISNKTWAEAVSPSSFPKINGAPTFPYGIAFNSAGDMLVSAATNPGASEILEFTNTAGTWTNTATLTGISNARGLTFDSSGNLFAVSEFNGVLEYPSTGAGTYSNSPNNVLTLSNPQLLGDAFDPTTGYFLVANDFGSQGQHVLAYTLSGNPPTANGNNPNASYSTGSGSNPQYLAPFSASPSVATLAPGGLVLFALGFGGLGLVCRWRSGKIAPHDAAAT